MKITSLFIPSWLYWYMPELKDPQAYQDERKKTATAAHVIAQH